MELTKQQREFLSILAKFSGPVSRSLLPLADRRQDRVRQSCRRLGYAEFKGGWIITPAGRAALEPKP